MSEAAVGMSALQAMPLLAGVTEHDLRNILKIGELRSFEPGQAVVEHGEPADALYIVLRGAARVEVGGRTHELGMGDFFGEMALVAGGKRTATVTASEPLDTLRIDAEAFHRWLLHEPKVALQMLTSLVERLREVQGRLDAWAGMG